MYGLNYTVRNFRFLRFVFRKISLLVRIVNKTQNCYYYCYYYYVLIESVEVDVVPVVAYFPEVSRLYKARGE